jgi:hypothetical protein
MPSSITLIDKAGTAYHLAGAGVAYTGSGTPWTSQSTSPFELSMNDATGNRWTPAAPQPLTTYDGAPPWALGARPLTRGYGNVTEVIGLQARANSHNNAVALLRLLRRIAGQTLRSSPILLAVQPNGATSAAYFEVYDLHVQELPAFINEEAASSTQLVRMALTLTRSPFGGRQTTAETVVSAAAWQNRGTGTPDNILPFSTGAGDLIYEGQPLNVRLSGVNDTSNGAGTGQPYRLVASTIDSVVYSTTGAGAHTNDVFFVTGASALSITPMLTKAVALRIICRFTTNVPTAVAFQIVDAVVGDDIVAYVPAVTISGDSTGGVVDSGPIALDTQHLQGVTAPKVGIITEVTGSMTLVSTELIFYYTWLEVIWPTQGGPVVTDNTYTIHTFAEQSGYACLPEPPTVAAYTTVGATLNVRPTQIRGSYPIFLEGASLWLLLEEQDSSSGGRNVPTTTTGTVTATNAPLYATLRGGG